MDDKILVVEDEIITAEHIKISPEKPGISGSWSGNFWKRSHQQSRRYRG